MNDNQTWQDLRTLCKKKNVIAKVLFNTNFLITPMNITLKW